MTHFQHEKSLSDAADATRHEYGLLDIDYAQLQSALKSHQCSSRGTYINIYVLIFYVLMP
jgi:hypothetical protein